MAEEITREIIQEIAKETVQEMTSATSQSFDWSWIISIITIIVVSGGFVFSIYKFNDSQKKHNKTQEKVQNLEFMKQLEYYDGEFNKTSKTFVDSNQRYSDCYDFAQRWLGMLDKLSYLNIKELVNQDFMQYFENNFNSGRTLLNWLKFTNIRPTNLDNRFPHFNKVEKTIDYLIPKGVVIHTSFYYFARQFQNNNEYDHKKDTTDSKTYLMESEDIGLIRPE